MGLEEIKKELDEIGATYVVSQKNIKAIFPKGTTVASVPTPKGGTPKKDLENFYFQNGIKIVFPARNKYYVAGILGQQVILSPI